MEEKVLSGKKHGMFTLLCCVAVMLLAVAGVALLGRPLSSQ